MREELVSFKVAKLAKEKGFNEKSQYYYVLDFGSFQRITTPLKFKTPLENENIYQSCKLAGSQPHLALAPTQSLLQKWLREVHKINVESNYLPNIQKYSCLYIPMTGKTSIKDINYVSKIRFNTYEEALELGLQGALKLIKNEKGEI